eukprot:TRINITY_DN14631_c0_g1_i4.p1 TRINITY_DN14631_c0_g1~~TRINITY_DN14631_c0_g1_i4.p1  ORF type:complete len:457 (-),score=117.38 TRINITY_DN14631_c0_g1_i4:277-1647(-)
MSHMMMRSRNPMPSREGADPFVDEINRRLDALETTRSGGNASTPGVSGKTTRVVGVQSGNAVDGIDVGIFDFGEPVVSTQDPRNVVAPIPYTTLANKTFNFTPEQREYVLALRRMRHEDGNKYAEGNYEMGAWLADCCLKLIAESGIPKESIHLIGSHGQTVSGHPHWEFGDLSVIAQRTGITTVGDFRPADVAAGGNGTPCTCTYDSIMLRDATAAPDAKWRVAINIGGTSSVTFLPPQASDDAPLGLDPGLGVFFMDLCVREIDSSLEYDDNGDMARSGTLNQELLDIFLQDKYYQQDALPIGVGPDDFPERLFHEWHGIAQSKGVSNIDLLNTLTELTTVQLGKACKRFGGSQVHGATDVILRGSVYKNSYFMERLNVNMSKELESEGLVIKLLDDIGISEDSWENAMYALFGFLCFRNLYNFVPSCTGASRRVVGGRIAPGENFKSVALLNL